MKIAVLGTGMVGRTIAARLDELGHDVVVGTRDPEATRARDDAPAFAFATVPDAVTDAEIVINATNGTASIAMLSLAGADLLAGKVLLDIANPLDFSNGFPPTLLVKDTDSLAEQVQRAFPDARVVKSLNTLTADLMVRPDLLPEGTSVFVSGDDASAKATVTALLEEFGHTDVIDLGDITTARGTEMMLPVWLRLMGALGTPMFNFKVVR